MVNLPADSQIQPDVE